MPYIKKSKREKLVNIPNPVIQGPGELNYFITEILVNYLHDNGEQYQQYNDIIGALESCKLEFYRRMMSKYEDNKIEENGDVY